MKKKPAIIVGVCCLVLLGCALQAGAQESAKPGDRIAKLLLEDVKPPEALLPPGVKVAPGFEPGAGRTIGQVELVQGEGLLGHHNAAVVYEAKKNLPLFSRDVLITGERARIRAQFSDKSAISVSPYSKLVIDQSIYDPNKDERASTFSLLFGKIRLIASKLRMGYDSDLMVKTPTAVAGVRGSDFALAVIPKTEPVSSCPNWLASLFGDLNPLREAHAQIGSLMTIVVTGPGTTVSFSGMIGGPVLVGPLSTSFAMTGLAASVSLPVSIGLAGGVLNGVGPGLSLMSMPPEFD
ncbi:MAG: FecR family protein [Proteobacteria bacterium]|nr:FecR family protein [Pseudomonadota bacterium]